MTIIFQVLIKCDNTYYFSYFVICRQSVEVYLQSPVMRSPLSQRHTLSFISALFGFSGYPSTPKMRVIFLRGVHELFVGWFKCGPAAKLYSLI
jgi:hypothetical protein